MGTYRADRAGSRFFLADTRGRRDRQARVLLLLGAFLLACGSGRGSEGDVVWARGAGGEGEDRAYGLAVYEGGATVLTGYFSTEATFGAGGAAEETLEGYGNEDVFVARYDRDGTLLWAKRAGGTGNDRGYGAAAVVDGSALVGGCFSGTATFGSANLTAAGNYDVFVAKFDSEGTVLWAKRAGGTGDDRVLAVAAFSDGSVCATGYFEGTAVFAAGEGNETSLVSEGSRDIFVARYNTDGTLAWARGVGSSDPDAGRGAAVLFDGSVVVTGSFRGTVTFGEDEGNETDLTASAESDAFVAKYGSSGLLAWARRAGGSADDAGRGAVGLADGSVLMSGHFGGVATFGPGQANQTVLTARGVHDAFVAHYGSGGELQWVRSAGGTDAVAQARAVVGVWDGSSVMLGTFSGNVTFGAGEVGETLLASAGTSCFLAAYGAYGSLNWVRRVQGTSFGQGLAVTAEGTPLVSGYYNGTVVFEASGGNVTLPPLAGLEGEVFLARFSSGPPAVRHSSLASDNSYLDITFNKGIYGDTDASEPAGLGDFTISFQKNDGYATAVSLAAMTRTDASALEGGETTLRLHFLVAGTPSGQETLEVRPAGDTRLYDADGFPVTTDVTTGTLHLNPGARVLLTENGGTSVTEGGATDTYTLTLASRPAADVEVVAADSDQFAVSPSHFTFTSSDWNVAQTATVTATDDYVIEGNHTAPLAHSVVSEDTRYHQLAVPEVTVTLVDNDAAGVSRNESGGSTTVVEGGATDTYTLTLSAIPQAPVTVTVTPDSQIEGSDYDVLFQPDDWNVPRTITVHAKDDNIPESNHTGRLSHSVTSDDPAYDGIAVLDILVAIADNDSAGVAVAANGGELHVTEDGETDTYTLTLTSRPLEPVTILMTTGTQLATNESSVTFSPAQWDQPKTITVSAVDDGLIEGNHNATITHSTTSADPVFHELGVASVAVSLVDNDAPGVVVSQSGGSTSVTEGDVTDAYTVVLASVPAADVVITLTPDDQLSLDKSALTFTPETWNVVRTVTVTAVDDGAVEGTHNATITHVAASADPDYAGIAVQDLTVTVTDDDSHGVALSQSGGSTSVAEGGDGDTYTLRLTSRPVAGVVVTIQPDAQVYTDRTTLIFTAEDWRTAQTVTVFAIDDGKPEQAHHGTLSHVVTSSDPDYDGFEAPGVTVSITDNDSYGVAITEVGGSTTVTEGGEGDQYGLVLTGEPGATVTVTAGAGDQVSVAPSTFVFTLANWNVVHTATIAAIDDVYAEGTHTATVVHTASSTDLNYSSIAVPPLSVTVVDNESGGVSIVETGGNTAVVEGGATDTYNVVLTEAPLAAVTVAVSADSQLTLTPASLLFTPGDWASPQTVTVSAVNDNVGEGAHSATITHSVASTDASFNGITVPSVTVAITDNESAGIRLLESDGTTAVSEAGETDSYTLALTGAPEASVVIAITAGSQVTVEPGAVFFTTENWNTPQTVTVSAVDDTVGEGTHHATLTHGVTSQDAAFNGLALPDVTVEITDDDGGSAGLVVTESGGATAVGEGGETDTVALSLASIPSSGVMVKLDPGIQLTLDKKVVVFTDNNWSQSQTVTVSARDDNVVEGDHEAEVNFSLVSSDITYGDLEVTPLSVSVADNDQPALRLVETGDDTTVAEGGATDTYGLVLASEPTDAVTVSLGAGDQLAVDPVTLTFTTGDWATTRTVTVTAVDDDASEGDHTGTVVHTLASDDSRYDGLSAPGLTVTVVDNDGDAEKAVDVWRVPADTETLTTGETLTLRGNVSLTESADLYVAILDPFGNFYCVDENGELGEANFLWPYRTRLASPLRNETFFDAALPRLPSGGYEGWLIAAEEGQNVLDGATWLGSDATTWRFAAATAAGLTLNASSYAPGDTLALLVTTPPAGVVDLYLWLDWPGGVRTYMTGPNRFAPAGIVAPLLTQWTSAELIEIPLLEVELPAELPGGDYAFALRGVEPGADPGADTPVFADDAAWRFHAGDAGDTGDTGDGG